VPPSIRGDSHGEGASLTQPKIFATRATFLELCTCRSERRWVDYEELSAAEIAKRAITRRVRTLADHKVSVLSRLSRTRTGDESAEQFTWPRQVVYLARIVSQTVSVRKLADETG